LKNWRHSRKSLDLVGQGEREGRRRKQELSATIYPRCWANMRKCANTAKCKLFKHPPCTTPLQKQVADPAKTPLRSFPEKLPSKNC
jgi:hypothetical protein